MELGHMQDSGKNETIRPRVVYVGKSPRLCTPLWLAAITNTKQLPLVWHQNTTQHALKC